MAATVKPSNQGRLPRRVAVNVPLVAAAFLLPFMISSFWTGFLTGALLLGLAGMSLVLTWSWGGMLSFGQAAFFGIGAYFGGWAYRPECVGLSRGGRSTEASCEAVAASWFVPAMGIVAAALLGCLVAAIAFRAKLSSFLFAILTLITTLVMTVLATGIDLTNRETGFFPIPPIEVLGFSPVRSMYFIALCAFLAGMVALWLVQRSKFGLVLRAIRDNELRAISVGHSVDALRILVFGAGAGLAAFAGILYAHYSGIVTPRVLGFELGANLVIWLVLGGRNYLLGPIVGYLMVNWTQITFAQGNPEVIAVISSIVFIVLILWAPDGVLGLLHRGAIALWRRLPVARAPDAARHEPTETIDRTEPRLLPTTLEE